MTWRRISRATSAAARSSSRSTSTTGTESESMRTPTTRAVSHHTSFRAGGHLRLFRVGAMTICAASVVLVFASPTSAQPWRTVASVDAQHAEYPFIFISTPSAGIKRVTRFRLRITASTLDPMSGGTVTIDCYNRIFSDAGHSTSPLANLPTPYVREFSPPMRNPYMCQFNASPSWLGTEDQYITMTGELEVKQRPKRKRR
jgi:hypothetical protein